MFKKASDLIEFLENEINNDNTTFKINPQEFGYTEQLIQNLAKTMDNAKTHKIINVLLYILKDNNLSEFQKGFIVNIVLTSLSSLKRVLEMLSNNKRIN